MFYVIHTGLDPSDDATILGIYNNEVDARQFVEAYVRDHGERDCLFIAKEI